MLFLIGAWSLLIVVALVLGTALFPLDRIHRAGDRLMLGLWLGLIVLCCALLTLSLVIPLASGAAAVIVGSVILGLVPRARRAGQDLWRIPRPVLAGGLLLLVVVAAIGAQRQATYGDIGLYHYPILRWLADYGTVPGLALLYHQFGMAAAWYGPAAVFDVGPFVSRVDAIPGGLVLLLACCHVALAVYRVLERRGTRADIFVGTAFLLGMPFLAGKVALSPSPDAVVAALAILTGWSMFPVATAADTDSTGGETATPARRRELMSLGLVPVVLAAGAVGMKLSAVPLLAVALLFCGVRASRPARTLVAGSSVALLFLIPSLLYGFMVSGCPLYPLPLCMDVTWSLEPAMWSDHAAHVRDATGGVDNPTAPSSWRRILPNPQTNPFLAGGLLLSFLYGIPTLVRGGHRAGIERTAVPDAERGIAAIALVGVVFVLLNAPLLRFVIGYAVLLPALFISRLSVPRRRAWAPPRPWIRIFSFPLPATVAALCLLTAYPILNVLSIPRYGLDRVVNLSRVEWVRPVALPSEIPVIERQVNGIHIRSPKSGGRCWAVEAPCTPGLSSSRIRLRDPSRGIAGGFVRTPARGARSSVGKSRG